MFQNQVVENCANPKGERCQSTLERCKNGLELIYLFLELVHELTNRKVTEIDLNTYRN